MKKLCIYHGSCADGFGAAIAVRIGLGAENVDFFEGRYQETPPDVTGLDVIIVDFSYKRDALIDMSENANSILIIDHHKSAEADLVDLPKNVTANFDMERSGAVMSWEYFIPSMPVPDLFLHIQDRDLWKFELDGTREIMACVFSHPYDFEIWHHLLIADLEELRTEGKALERKHFKDIRGLIDKSAYRAVIGGYDVPVMNAPGFFSSDAGHIMSDSEPFAAVYWDTPKGRQFSLRSAKDGLDVSEIAAKFGGGGHKNAAGFSLESRVMPG